MDVNKQQIIEYLEIVFPQSLKKCEVVSLEAQGATVLYKVDDSDLRPGGTVSGPAMMTIADFAFYIAIFSAIGLESMAVTSQLNFNFLRKPSANVDLKAQAHLIKIGKQLVVGEVWVYSLDQAEPVAHATGSYVLPLP